MALEPKIMRPVRATLHCSASKNGIHYDIEQVRKDHLARGFSDIGYHALIQPDGEIQNGRPLNQPGAHVVDANFANLGVCLVGTDRFTRAQFNSLESVLDSWFMNFDIKEWELWCHYQWPSAQKQGKTCPNIGIQSLLCWYHMKLDKAIEPYLLK